MAKNNKGKVIQMLSPENYMKQKAKNLLIYECLINSSWAKSKFANIIIARQHTTGNITACVYLVDLMCLGVKDTLFTFNTTKEDYNKLVESFLSSEMHERISYELAHNIIYAALDYSNELGFKPHKQFTTTTRFMLEEDTDDIELIEVECGLNGKPCYTKGPEDSEQDTTRILAQLEHAVGNGNYDYILEVDYENFDNEYKSVNDGDEFDNLDLNEKRALFLKYYNKIEKLTEDDLDQFGPLVVSIFDDLIDVEEHNAFYDEIERDLDIEVEEEGETIPDQLLGYESDSHISITMKERFIELLNDIHDLKMMKKKWQLFKKEFGDSPAADYIELVFNSFSRSRSYKKMLNKYAQKHPNYALLQIKWTKRQIDPDRDIATLPRYPFTFNDFFTGRKRISAVENFAYVDFYLHKILWEKNAAKLSAFNSILEDIGLKDHEIEQFTLLIFIFKTQIIANYFESN